MRLGDEVQERNQHRLCLLDGLIHPRPSHMQTRVPHQEQQIHSGTNRDIPTVEVLTQLQSLSQVAAINLFCLQQVTNEEIL